MTTQGRNIALKEPVLTTELRNFDQQFTTIFPGFLTDLDCRNVTIGKAPPITTWEELGEIFFHYPVNAQRQPNLEAWFLERVRITHDAVTLGTVEKYQQIHIIEIEGLVWGRDFQTSYRYIQDKADEIIIGAERNKDLLLGDFADTVLSQSAQYNWQRFGEVYLQRMVITLQVLSTVTETGGRVTS